MFQIITDGFAIGDQDLFVFDAAMVRALVRAFYEYRRRNLFSKEEENIPTRLR